MTTLILPALDHGKIRVFSYSGPLSDALREKQADALAGLFGSDALDPNYIDAFEVEALGDLSLSSYLATGYDVAADPMDATALADLSGVIILIMSRAHREVETTLTLAPHVTHVTTIGEGASLNLDLQLQSEAAVGVLEDQPQKKPMSNARQSGMVATVALLVMFALVALMVWIGG